MKALLIAEGKKPLGTISYNRGTEIGCFDPEAEFTRWGCTLSYSSIGFSGILDHGLRMRITEMGQEVIVVFCDNGSEEQYFLTPESIPDFRRLTHI